MKITEVQAQALTAFVIRIRPEWRAPGVMAAIGRARDGADVHDVACALIRLAEDKSVLTPGLLHQPGPHWLKPDGSKPHRRGDHTMTCPDHGEPYLRCSECAAIQGTPPPTDVKAEIAEALEAAKTQRAKDDAARRDREAARHD